MSDFFHFSDLIPKAVAKYNLQRETCAAQVCQRFRELAPTLIDQEAGILLVPQFFRGGILYVNVPNSLWAQKVLVKRHELLERLNADVNLGVKDIRTRVA